MSESEMFNYMNHLACNGDEEAIAWVENNKVDEKSEEDKRDVWALHTDRHGATDWVCIYSGLQKENVDAAINQGMRDNPDLTDWAIKKME